MPQLTYQPADKETLTPVRTLEDICRKYEVPPGALALQFAIRNSKVISTVVGVSKPERVTQSLEWASLAIPQGLWDEIDGLPFSSDDPEANREYKPG